MAKKEVKTTKKENSNLKENKNKKTFWKSLKVELKKVIWPTPKQLFNNTVAVISIVLVTAVIVCVLNLAFEALNRHGIDKIKESMQNTNTNSVEAENTTSEENAADDASTSEEQTEDTEVNTDTTEQKSQDSTNQDANEQETQETNTEAENSAE